MEGKLVGVHKVNVKLADGTMETYYYAWRGKGAPRMQSKPGTKAFTLEFLRLTRDRQRPATTNTIGSLIDEYRQTARYKALSPSTRRDYERIFGAIRLEYGDCPLAAVEARGSRRGFLSWRDKMKDSPRSADMHIALLSRLFAWAKDSEYIMRNPLERVERLHEGSRKDIIWSSNQISKLLSEASPHIRDVAKVALWTMQRQADILTMPTLAFDGERLSIKQGKTGARVRVIAAPDLMPMLREAKKAQRQRVLVNSFGQNWTSSGFRASWRKEMARLGIKGVTFHDLRGTAITFAYAHLDRPHDEKIKLISEISGHSREDAESIIRKHYLAGQEVIDAIGRGTTRE
ncbi:integrase [Agrobacterium vitis]|uniref:tyrosine-type recombinase/integrase n=1 Tax=Rhizobium/Agrobacterium group TaxID=227290 RepID=UPI0012E7F11B|nr:MULTISPECIES: integrase [Rhizobium/Agrobacterium group]MCF1492665.1 integrase [Allorhizobium ampelinum]MVA44709.1 integrase [Agrobacterium vitis]